MFNVLIVFPAIVYQGAFVELLKVLQSCGGVEEFQSENDLLITAWPLRQSMGISVLLQQEVNRVCSTGT